MVEIKVDEKMAKMIDNCIPNYNHDLSYRDKIKSILQTFEKNIIEKQNLRAELSFLRSKIIDA